MAVQNVMSGLAAEERLFVEESCARLVEDRARLGGLFASMKFKGAMVERFGVQRAFELCREHLDVPGADLLRHRRVVSLRSVAEREPSFTELWPGGRRFVHPAPTVVGEGDQSDQHGTSRSAYLTCLRDALVRGRSAVILVEDVALVDFEGGEPSRFEDNPAFDPAVLHATGDGYWTLEPGSPPRVIDEALTLLGTYAHDFGHWLTEHLPKLAIALMAGLPRVPILIDQRLPGTHRQALDLLLPGCEILTLDHLAPARVGRLWCAPSPTYRGFSPSRWSEAWHAMLPDPEGFARILRELESLAGEALTPPTGRDRIFLARRPPRKKKLVNYHRIEQIAATRGFEVVVPEDLPFLEQLRLVHHATHIVAPDGSNGLLCYFASEGARVCFLNHSHTRPLVELNGVLAALGARFVIVTGPVVGEPSDEPFWDDYAIDETVFGEFLDSWL